MPGPWGEPILASATFTVDAADIAASYRADLRWRFTRPASYIVPVLAGFGAMTGIAITDPEAPAWVLAIAFASAVLLALSFRLTLFVSAPLLAQRTMRHQKNLKHEWHVELTKSGPRAVTPKQKIFTAWSEYVAWLEDRRVILVYQSDRLYQFMPRRAATPELLAAFHELKGDLPKR